MIVLSPILDMLILCGLFSRQIVDIVCICNLFVWNIFVFLIFFYNVDLVLLQCHFRFLLLGLLSRTIGM
jgi:hypothetical protein